MFYLVLEDLPAINAHKGDLIGMSEQSAAELDMPKLIEDGFFQELSPEEAEQVYRQQNPPGEP